MTREELLARLRAGEDTLTELKTAGHGSEVKRGIVALANSATPERAGVLFLDARQDGNPIGVENATSFGEKVATWASECYPSIRFECVVLPLDGRDILAVVVPASSDRPHFAAPASVRDGPKTVKAPPGLYDELIAGTRKPRLSSGRRAVRSACSRPSTSGSGTRDSTGPEVDSTSARSLAAAPIPWSCTMPAPGGPPASHSSASTSPPTPNISAHSDWS